MSRPAARWCQRGRPRRRRCGAARHYHWDMLGAPDEHVDAAKFHAQDLQRAMLRDRRPGRRTLTRVRLIVRRVLGRGEQSSPAGPRQD